jgi:uncharacterized membrane protein
MLIGGNIFNRIGAIALLIGVGFFIKYAFDQNWITEQFRVLAGLFVGIGLLAGGSYFHRKEAQIFAQGLFGAGISILYLSIYASFNFYSVISQGLAMVGMAVITFAAITLAYRYDSIAISLLAWAGGFLILKNR